MPASSALVRIGITSIVVSTIGMKQIKEIDRAEQTVSADGASTEIATPAPTNATPLIPASVSRGETRRRGPG